jgi:putative DNA primase/helicase
MTPLNIAGQGAYATRHCMITSENASGGTEALKLNQPNATIDWEKNLRNRLKLALRASPNVEADAMAEVVVFTTDTAANDLLQEDCPDALIDLPVAPVVPVAPSAPVVPILRYKLLTDDDLSKLPPVQWRIKDVLPSHGTAVVFGPSGSGKSFLVLDMLQSLAFGCEWFGRRVKPCSVTYIALEGEAGLAGRVEAYRVQHGSASPNIRYMVQPFRLLDADDINELVQAIQAAGTGDVVVLDTLSRATPGSDENDSKAMGQIVASAKMLQDLIGGLVLLIHHTGKDASRGMRGHSSLYAALDCAIEVKRQGDHREWLLAKSKDGEDGASHPFKLETVHLRTDSDGDEITSCVIVANQSAPAIAKKMPTLGSNQTIALKALVEPLRESLDMDKDGAPQGKPCLLFEQALAIVALQMPGEAKHKKQRAKEALTKLVEKSMLGMKGEWLWVN